MKILAIETSCDETAIAILEIRGEKLEVRSNVVLSQIKIHKPFGGVVPNLAKREHEKNLPIVLERALKEAKISPKKIDAIAVTYGPGLEPALWMGINFAKELSKKWKKPIIPVNHLEGHIYASWLSEKIPKFPLLALIVSGGHTELVFMKKHLDYKILGETLDDAAGEAFDKVARLLKLGYPGGPEISRLAEKERKTLNLRGLAQRDGASRENFQQKIIRAEKIQSFSFPRPMINSPDLNFSFSGLKTAVLYYLRDNPNANKSEIAYEFEQAVIDVLVHKTEKAIKKYKPKSLVVGGGVAANHALRSALEDLVKKYNYEKKHLFPAYRQAGPTPLLTKERGTKGVRSGIFLFLSPLWLTGDNAAMIAVAAYFKARKKQFTKPEKIVAKGNLKLG